MTLQEDIARAVNVEGWSCYGGAHEPGQYDDCEDCKRVCDTFAAALMPLVKRAQAEALRDYAQSRYLDFLDSPEKTWREQPEGMARRYAKVAAEMLAHADRIEKEGQSDDR